MAADMGKRPTGERKGIPLKCAVLAIDDTPAKFLGKIPALDRRSFFWFFKGSCGNRGLVPHK
jgi:hypothetical protein